MNDENWIDQYKHWKPSLKSFQLKLLEEGPNSQSQAWLFNSMWCEWQDIKKSKEQEFPHLNEAIKDPWGEEGVL